MGGASPGAFNRENITVLALMTMAYDLPSFQITGGPDWIRTQRFDVRARMDAATTPAQARLMVQSLLEDRFRLKAGLESREMRGFALVRSKTTELGAMMKPSRDCSEMVDAPANAPPKAVRRSGCLDMAGMAQSVARQLSVPVIDRTSLSGFFSFQMFYASEGSIDVAGEPNAPAFTTALQEQLGLTLESTRGPVDVLVIDSIQQPTEN
jgi:uncharacterized protein (TIGR03435 family)